MRLLLALLLFAALHVQAAEPYRLEAIGGTCNVTWSGDGVWYNSNYPGSIDTSATCGQISVSRLTGTWLGYRTGWRLAYVDFGTLRWTSTYPLRDDEQFTLKPSGLNCDYLTAHGCVGTSDHWQNERGMSLGWIVETEGSVALGFDAGLYLYYGEYQYTQRSYPVEGIYPTSTTPQYGGWQLTPYAGLTLRWWYLYAEARAYASIKAARHGCSECSGLSHSIGTQIGLGLSASF